MTDASDAEGPLVSGNLRPSEFFDWAEESPERRRTLRDHFFQVGLPVDADLAFYVHFDEVTHLLSMPPRPDGDEGRWEELRCLLESEASSIAGRRVQSYWQDDRYYRFRFHEFEEVDWSTLHATYTRLPGWIGGDPSQDIPRWFGLSDEYPPYLWASVETFGLEVMGVLPLDAWRGWHAAFVEGVAELPAMSVSVMAVVGGSDGSGER